MLDGMSDSIQGSRIKNLHSREVDRQSPTWRIFLHVFGRAPSDLQLCFVQLKTLPPSSRYSTFKYPVTLKPGLWVTQGHQKLYQSIRHPRLPMNVPPTVMRYLLTAFPIKVMSDRWLFYRSH